jgi:hypothetical protein
MTEKLNVRLTLDNLAYQAQQSASDWTVSLSRFLAKQYDCPEGYQAPKNIFSPAVVTRESNGRENIIVSSDTARNLSMREI